jgi:hypothetical protein
MVDYTSMFDVAGTILFSGVFIFFVGELIAGVLPRRIR